MIYVMSVTSAGQVTIPKELRDNLGITTAVEVQQDGDKVVMSRAKSLRERMHALQATFTPEQKAAIKRNAGKTVSQLREELWNTPEGRAYIKEVYGA